MKFSDVLASSIHDIKNSLSMVINTLEELVNDPNTHISDDKKMSILQHEAQRANSTLIQLLGLYKFENEQVTISINEHSMEDFLEEVVAENQALAAAFNVSLEYVCDEYLTGYFDEELVRGVINSAIGNALRYTQEKISLSAAMEDGFLVLRVEDDGNGFPEHILALQHADPQADDLNTGRTQLGMVFADKVAASHRQGDKQGDIRLTNKHRLDGGCFELRLP